MSEVATESTNRQKCHWQADKANKPVDDKTNKMTLRLAKTQISLDIRPVRSESSLSEWRKIGSLATYWVHSEKSDQTRRMPRLIRVFAGRPVILLVLSRGGSNEPQQKRRLNLERPANARGVSYKLLLSFTQLHYQRLKPREWHSADFRMSNNIVPEWSQFIMLSSAYCISL